MNNMVNWLIDNKHNFKELNAVDIVEVQYSDTDEESFMYHPIDFESRPDNELIRKLLSSTVCAYVSKHNNPTKVLTTGFIYNYPFFKFPVSENVLQERGYYCILMKIV